ncbi:hypothetical protein HNR46_003369 [Haloferula luteola]|uniref:Lipoprotein n=1 Tax=Haloferula luteola TaxID=595692 RepID=A0A840V7U3_9BACT|nr:hypothetical protein [Haloferula luteola]MBB5353116.1 hypothetical protein [Haloferula luteola]
MRSLLWTLPLITAGFLCSCGTMKSMTEATGRSMGKMGQAFGAGVDKMATAATSPFKPGIPVVEARPDDFEKVQSGHEQAIAYQRAQNERRSGFWALFSGPSDFEEPALPEMNDSNFEGGLLPPKAP